MTLATVTVYIPTIIYLLIQAALRRPFIIVLLAIYHLKYKKNIKQTRKCFQYVAKSETVFSDMDSIYARVSDVKKTTTTIKKKTSFFFPPVSASSISSSNTAFTENFTPTRPTQLFPCRLRLNLHS